MRILGYKVYKVRPRPAKTLANDGLVGYKIFKVKSRKDDPSAAPAHGARTVLNEAHHDPTKQLDLNVLIVRIIVLAQLLMEKRFYPYQVALARRVIESLLMHDGDVITSLMSRQAGKCLAKGTRVLMFDGSTKAVEDVCVGDLLMGDDSTSRTVLSLAHGHEEMIEVRPRCGYAESYTVNRSHILSVLRKFRHNKPSEVQDLSVAEIQALPEYVTKNMLSGYKVAIEYPRQLVQLNPYWLGLWLGDGGSRDTRITSGDAEIVEWLTELAELNGMRLSKYEERGACASYAIVNEAPSRSVLNPFIDALRKYDLLQNKHIPLQFLSNSRRVRLALLAGLIDSDGALTKSGYEITQVNHQLALDTQTLARSLGYRCSISRSVKSCQTGACVVAWRLSLYGALWELPVKVARKKFTSKPLRENPLSYGFDLVPQGRGEYFGFVINGNKRFVLADFTVTHNTEVIGGISGALSLILPLLAKRYPDDWRLNITDDQGNYRGFATGLAIGIYAPKQEQSEITFNRVKRAFDTKNGKRILGEMKVVIEENNGNTLAFSNGSKVLCQSASKQSEIEGATHHMLIAEEAQDIDDLKMRKSLHPMVASTMGTIVKIGTASVRKCDFYNAIANNRREELLTKRRNHFFFPWTVCAKYNSLYRRYIEGEKKKIGETSDEFRMAYCGEWIFERGMFITQDVLFSPQVAHTNGIWSQFYPDGYRGPSILRHFSWVVGIDWGRSSDSTVVCLMAVDWANPMDTGETSDASGTHRFAFYNKHIVGLWEYQGDNYEYQYGEIANRLQKLPGLCKIVMDSNSCGAPMFDRFAASFGPLGVEVTPFNFQPKVKSDGYKSFGSDLWAGRITFPAGGATRSTMEFRKFVQQMLDLKKDWQNGIMKVAHPEERGAHDDYPDAAMLAAWGCNTPAIGGRVEFSNSNPFV